MPGFGDRGDGCFAAFAGWVTDHLARRSPGLIAMTATLGLIGAYALSRILMQFFAQCATGSSPGSSTTRSAKLVFAAFAHMHTLSLRFHLERKTGGLSRIIERGTKGIDTLLSFTTFSIFPTLLQLFDLHRRDDLEVERLVAATALAMVAGYVGFTFAITRWRVRFRREMNDSDTDANTKAVRQPAD